MDDTIRVQLLEDISLLIKEGIGVIYNGDGRWCHVFNLIFNKFAVQIELSFDLDQVSVDICEGISCNSISYEKGDPGVDKFITSLKDKFSLDNSSNVINFLDEMENYKNGDLESLQLKMDRFLNTEKFEEAEKIRLRMKKIEENHKKRKK